MHSSPNPIRKLPGFFQRSTRSKIYGLFRGSLLFSRRRQRSFIIQSLFLSNWKEDKRCISREVSNVHSFLTLLKSGLGHVVETFFMLHLPRGWGFLHPAWKIWPTVLRMSTALMQLHDPSFELQGLGLQLTWKCRTKATPSLRRSNANFSLILPFFYVCISLFASEAIQ